MGAITPNFNLFKPDFPDPANIVVAVANNMDILDGELGKIKEAIDGFSPDQNAALPADLLSAFGNVMQILSWYSALFKAVTGEADWFDPPAVPLNEKVTGIWTIYDRYTLEAAYNLTENETLDQIADLVPDYSIVVIHLANNSWMNLPPLNTQGIVWITKTHSGNSYAQFWDQVANTQYFNNRGMSGLFLGWQQVAQAAQPTSYVPQLGANFTAGTGDPFYYKNQFGEVNVSADVVKSSDIVTGDLIATLPAGFRPTRRYELPAAYFNTSNGTNYGGFVRFDSNGQITAQLGQIAGTVTAQQMSFQCVYLAGN